MNEWTSLKNGDNCPLCMPRADDDTARKKIASLSVSTLYLDTNQTYRGYCILVFDKHHANGIESLTADEYNAFMKDFYTCVQAVKKTFNPEHVNYASLGNVVPHLHLHLIPRYFDDPRWRAPIWTDEKNAMPITHLDGGEYDAMIKAINQNLSMSQPQR